MPLWWTFPAFFKMGTARDLQGGAFRETIFFMSLHFPTKKGDVCHVRDDLNANQY